MSVTVNYDMVMDVSIAFARIWGGFFIIFGFLFLISKFLGKVIEMSDNKFFTVATGYNSMMFGLATVVLHNIWALDWRLFITILGWSTLIKGVMKIGFPEQVNKNAQHFKKNQWVSALAMFAMGGWLLWKSFVWVPVL